MPVEDIGGTPERIWVLVDRAAPRFGSDNRPLVLAQVARETIAALVGLAVTRWARERRLPDLTAANVALREGPRGVVVGLRSDSLAVLPDDPLAVASEPATVEVIGEAEMFDRLLRRVLGYPIGLGETPNGPADRVAAVATVIAATRHVVRCGERHLWGSAALTIGNTLARLSQTLGKQADRDRAALFAVRPDLIRTVELVAVEAESEPEGETICALRRTCCLLFKLPGGSYCGTCSLRGRDARVADMTAWLDDRSEPTSPQEWEGAGGAPGTSSRVSSS